MIELKNELKSKNIELNDLYEDNKKTIQQNRCGVEWNKGYLLAQNKRTWKKNIWVGKLQNRKWEFEIRKKLTSRKSRNFKRRII